MTLQEEQDRMKRITINIETTHSRIAQKRRSDTLDVRLLEDVYQSSAFDTNLKTRNDFTGRTR